MEKKGSHAGVILSFVIFVLFLVTLVGIIEPFYKSDSQKNSVLNYANLKIVEYISGNLTEVSVRSLESISAGEYIEFEEGEYGGLDYIVKDVDENKLETFRSGGKLFIKFVESDKRIARIYYSEEELDGESSPFINSEPKQSEIVLVVERKVLFESKINKSINEYNENYELLKSEIGMQDFINFGFNFEGEDYSLKTNDNPLEGNIYSEENSIQYYDREANLKQGKIIVRIW